MKSIAALFVTRLLLVQVAVGAFTLVLIAVFASRLLLIDPRIIWATLPVTAACAASLFVVTVTLTIGLTRPLRKTLAALSVGLTAITPDDLSRLDTLPRKLTSLDAGAAVVVALLTLVPPVRPAASDLPTQAAIVLLAFTFASAAILPLYVMLRAQVAMVLEIAPLAALREALFAISESHPEKSYVPRRFVFAVTLPVAFVALGASLLVEAHGRAYEATAREDDAVALAHGAFDLVSGSSAGRSAAVAAAAAHGFDARVEAGRASVHTVQEIDRTVTEVPLEDGHAWVSFPAPPFSAILWAYGFVAVIGTTLAGVLGSRLGHRFASDIRLATRAVRETGAADVLRGSRVRREARFDSVIRLMDAIDSLGGVFREFASAQERAIDARAATERMRGLFLASMSHDLKGPLNAILGFAELVSRSPLSAAQQESLTIIEQRGRELLALIQTVLDSARAEAGELRVSPEWTMVGDVVMSAVLDARDLAVGAPVEIVAEIQPGVPRLYADGSRLVQALTAIIQSAVRFTQEGIVHVRATLPAGAPELRVDVETSGRPVPGNDREKLFDAFKETDRARQHGSLGLGLSLARSILELHGGSVNASVTKQGGTAFHVRIPTEAEEVMSALHRP